MNRQHLLSTIGTLAVFLLAGLPGQTALADDWGPLVGPWERSDQPIFASRQCGGNLVRFGGKWWMLLNGGAGQTTSLAVSNDGLQWEHSDHGVVLKPELPWEGSYNLSRSARVVGNQVWVYYFGKQGIEERIGLATTSDMKTFHKHPENPIFTKDDSNLPGERVFPGVVVAQGETQYLFYDIGFGYQHPEHPRHYKICAASGADGVHFSDLDQNPMIDHGSTDAWDDRYVCQPSVVKIDSWWYMLYVGMSSKQENKRGQSFGLARAKHPAGPWEKYPHNPVFTPSGDGESWDNAYLQNPCPVRIDRKWYLYYTGNDGKRYSVGMAALREPTSLIPGDANEDGMVTNADAAILATRWQMSSGATWADGDFNGDGVVTDADASILASHWQEGVPPSAATVPEPSTFVLVMIGSTTVFRFFRWVQ